MTMHLQELKGMQSSKWGMWKGYHEFVNRRYMKGVPFSWKMVSKRGQEVGPLGGASQYKNLLSTPPPQDMDRKKKNSQNSHLDCSPVMPLVWVKYNPSPHLK